MRFEPRLPDAAVNRPRVHALADLATLLGGVLAALLAVYLALGFAVDYAVDRLPPGFEASLRMERPATRPDADLAHARVVLDKLLTHAGPVARVYAFSLEIAPSDERNAMVLPGGHIVLFRGLLRDVGSENELAMVLGHEIGHVAQRDHLRGLGRGLVLVLLSTLLFGQDSGAADLLGGSLGIAHARFSRAQEQAADFFGLDLLHRTYGHVGGATTFFERMQAEDVRWAAWLATHPLSEQRVASLQQQARARGYRVADTVPLARGG